MTCERVWLQEQKEMDQYVVAMATCTQTRVRWEEEPVVRMLLLLTLDIVKQPNTVMTNASESG